MPNDYFRFKEFTIQQGMSAMKVTTDACLFGGWVAEKSSNQKNEAGSADVLDLGTGTGLLSLMLAQKLKARIDAVEIDRAAAEQANENIEASAWKEIITVIHADARHYAFNKRYDLIISNPPFYENGLRSPDASVNDARHDTALTFHELLTLVNKLLKQAGYFAVLIPFHRYAYLMQEAEITDLVPVESVWVKPTPKHDFTRAMILFKRSQPREPVHAPVKEELVIKEVHHSYSPTFIHYLEAYYLSL
jgi:tRNA1Val (adenine37-N6)-methyltransferase